MKIIILLIIISLHVLILAKIIFFPYPEVFVYPYLTNHGLIPYKQIFDQHFPGLMFLPINFNNLGMKDPQSARIWLMGIVALTHLSMFFFFNKILKDYKKTLMVNFVYLLWQPFLEGWVFWIEQFLAIFYIVAFYLTYDFLNQENKNYKKIILLGFVLGVSLIFKQVALPLILMIALIIYFYERSLKFLPYLLSGFAPPVFLVGFYFYIKGALLDMWFWTVWFNVTTFAKYGRKAPTIYQLIRILGIFSSVIFLPFLKVRKLKVLLAVFLIGSLAGAFNRFDFVHFQAALPFISLTTALVFFSFGRNFKFRIFILVYILMSIVWLSIFYKGHLGNKVFFFDAQTMEIANKIKSYSKPNEEIYLFGPVSHLYFLTDTIPSGRILVLQFPWFLMESEDRFLNALKTSPPNLIVRDRTVVIEGRALVDFAPRLDQYIEKNYQVFDKIGVTEFLRKK